MKKTRILKSGMAAMTGAFMLAAASSFIAPVWAQAENEQAKSEQEIEEAAKKLQKSLTKNAAKQLLQQYAEYYLDAMKDGDSFTPPAIKDDELRADFVREIYLLGWRYPNEYAEKAFRVLKGMSADPSAEVRRKVVVDLARWSMDNKSAQVLDLLNQMTTDSDDYVRAMAVQGAVKVGARENMFLVLDTLLKAELDPAIIVQKQVALLYGYLGAKDHDRDPMIVNLCVEQLKALIEREEANGSTEEIDGATIKYWAIEGLRNIGQYSQYPHVIKDIMNYLVSKVNNGGGDNYAYAIGGIGIEQSAVRQQAFDTLAGLAQSPDKWTRLTVTQFLDNLTDESPASYDTLMDVFLSLKDDPDQKVRNELAVLFSSTLTHAGESYAGKVFNAYKDVIEHKKTTSWSDFIPSRVGSIAFRYDSYAAEAVPLLSTVLKDINMNDDARHGAVRALVECAKNTKDSIHNVTKALLDGINDPDHRVRTEVFGSFADIADAYPAYAQDILDMLQDYEKKIDYSLPRMKESLHFWKNDIRNIQKRYHKAMQGTLAPAPQP